MSFISQHTAAEIERAISSVIADTSGDNAATAQTSLTNTWTIPLWTGNAGFVTVANLTSHVASGLTASDIGLGNVENTALSTWAGSTNLTTLGTITTGTWNGDTIASAYIGSHTHAASNVTSGTFADARIAETNVTQHEAALSITESQISDFGTYANAVHTHDADDIVSGTFADARIAQSNITQHQAALSITESQISDFGSYATTAALSSHTGDTSNPHSVTASQLSDFAEAVDDRVAVLVQDGTGITWTYADASNTLTGNVSLASFTTSDLSEGTNLYYTDARARAAISASGDLSYNSGTGVISFSETYGTASELLTALLTVDGTGSFLDADLLDGQEGTYYLAWANLTGVPSTFTPSAHTHASSEITDFQEAVEDVTGNLITAGTNISVSYNDVSGVLTISSTASTDSLDDIGDVTISSATTGDLVRWNGSAWVNYADSNYAASSHTHAASDVTSGTLADARIAESNVTQHESALSIASSQISDKASANGVASLDGSGKVPSSQLPAIALSEVFVVSSESAQLALTAQEGDTVVRTDQSKTYIHNGGTAGTMADYTELQVPSTAPVTSVNGYTGTVSLTTSDISEGTNLYYTSARFDSAFTAKDTDDLSEGATNQYFTNARSRSAISLTTTNSSELSYDSGTGVFSYVSPTTVADANSVTLEVRNTTGSTIAKGAAVYISGHSGSKILIDLADSDASGKYPAIGLASGAIANNSDGEVTVYGTLAGVDTSSYSVGDVLYLSSTAGALTNTRPTSNADAVQNIGKVARSDSNGIIIVSGSGRANDIPNLTNTHVFIGGASGNEQRALAAGDILSGAFADARISESSVTQHVAAIDHDSLLNFVANQHIDWTNATANFSTTGTASFGTTTVTGQVISTQGSHGASVVNASANGIQVIDNADNGISILTPNTATGSIFFGDGDDNFVGGFRYDHSADSLDVYVNNQVAYSVNSSRNHDFQSGNITTTGTASFGATTVTGTLTLPSGLGSTILKNSNDIFNIGRQASSGYGSISYASEVDGTTQDVWTSTTTANVQRSALVIGETVEIWHAAAQTTAVGLDVGLTKRFEIDGSGASITGTLGVSGEASINTGAFTDSASDTAGLILTHSGGTAALNGFAGSIKFGRIGSGSTTPRAAIAAYQDGADADIMGMKFYVHSSTSASDPLDLALTLDSSQNATFAGDVIAESETGGTFVAGDTTGTVVSGDFVGAYLFRSDDASGGGGVTDSPHYFGFKGSNQNVYGAGKIGIYVNRGAYENDSNPVMEFSGDSSTTGDHYATLYGDLFFSDSNSTLTFATDTVAPGDRLGAIVFHDTDGATGANSGELHITGERGNDKDAPDYVLKIANASGVLTERDRIDGTTGARTLTGDLTLSAGDLTVSGGILTIGGEGITSAYINSPENIYMNVDSNDNDAGSFFQWGANRTGSTGGEDWMRLSNGVLTLGSTSTSANAQFYSTKTYSNSASADIGSYFAYTQNSANSSSIRGLAVNVSATHTSGTAASVTGLQASAYATAAGGTTTALYAAQFDVRNTNASAVITSAYAVYIPAFTATGTITNRWGIYQAGASENNYFAGDLRIGTTSASDYGNEKLRVSSTAALKANFHDTAGGGTWIHFTNSTTGSGAGEGSYFGMNGSQNVGIINYEATPIFFSTADTERFRVASDAYALGIGTTDVESWHSGQGVIEFGASAISGSRTTDALNIMSNAYYDGSWKAKSTGVGSRYYLDDGRHNWYTVSSTTADAVITWSEKMRLTNDGALLIGTTSASGSELFKVDGDAVITGTMDATIDGGTY